MFNQETKTRFSKSFDKGNIIFSEGQFGREMYIILEGEVEIFRTIDNKEKTLAILKSGDIFGEMAIIENRPRSASVEAISYIKVLEFKKENFTTLLQSNPIWGIKLIKSFAKRIYEAKRRVRILLLEDHEIRVMDTFCMLAECKGVERNNFDPVFFKESFESIANWASIEIEECKKILLSLEKTGKIYINNDQITVKNINEFYRNVENKISMLKRMEESL